MYFRLQFLIDYEATAKQKYFLSMPYLHNYLEGLKLLSFDQLCQTLNTDQSYIRLDERGYSFLSITQNNTDTINFLPLLNYIMQLCHETWAPSRCRLTLSASRDVLKNVFPAVYRRTNSKGHLATFPPK